MQSYHCLLLRNSYWNRVTASLIGSVLTSHRSLPAVETACWNTNNVSTHRALHTNGFYSLFNFVEAQVCFSELDLLFGTRTKIAWISWVASFACFKTMFRPPSWLTGSGRPPDIPEETDNLEVNNFKISPIFFTWGKLME